MEKLTVIIPTFNEAHNIEDVLKSVDFADEIIVVDSFSTDETVQLAKKFTNVILQRKYQYSASQKNWAIPQASHNWILIVDADERVTPELKEEILGILRNNPTAYAGYWIKRMNHFMGKRIHFSGWRNDKVIRLFKKGKCTYEDKYVHAEMICVGKIGKLKSKLYHDTYISMDHHLEKLNRYANLQALDYDSVTGLLNPYHFVIKPCWSFIKHYLIQGGFRDGFVGFVIAYLQAYSVFMRYLKLWMSRHGLKNN